LSPAGFEDRFSTASGRYAAHRPDYPAELFDWLASPCQRHDLAWDCTTSRQADPQQRLAVEWPPHLRAGRKAKGA
jgi:hypothetical protein